MKKITIFGMLLLGICLVSCGPSKEDAIKYNDAVTKQQRLVVDAENKLIDAVKKGNDFALDNILKELSVQVDSSTAITKKMEKFDGTTDLRDAAITLFVVYRSVVDNEYTAWLLNLKTPTDMVNDKVLDEEKALIKAINDKLNKANDEFKRVQRAFAERYKFTISSY